MKKYLFFTIGMIGIILGLWNILSPTGLEALGTRGVPSTFGYGIIFFVIGMVFLFSAYQIISKERKKKSKS